MNSYPPRSSASSAVASSDARHLNQITAQIVDASMKVHTALGLGLLESAYEACLAHELRERGLQVLTQVGLPVIYSGVKLDIGYRIDLLIENAVIVEVKSVDAMAPVHLAQVITYLKLSDKRLGLLINFKVPHLKDGIKRVANQLREQP